MPASEPPWRTSPAPQQESHRVRARDGEAESTRRGGDAAPTLLADAHALVATHLEGPVAAEPYIQVVEYDPELRRWYVRFTCDGRDATTIYFDLHQRTLRYEVYFLPLPPDHHLELYELLLRCNHGMYGARFSLGPDGDVYLVGRVALEHLTVGELDRIIGVLYELTERWFQPVVRLAYGPRAKPPTSGTTGLGRHDT
jgi:Putative bacterial sensory transduction regulator